MNNGIFTARAVEYQSAGSLITAFLYLVLQHDINLIHFYYYLLTSNSSKFKTNCMSSPRNNNSCCSLENFCGSLTDVDRLKSGLEPRSGAERSKTCYNYLIPLHVFVVTRQRNERNPVRAITELKEKTSN